MKAGNNFIIIWLTIFLLTPYLFGEEKIVDGNSVITKGCLESLKGGTLFIDKVDLLPARIQKKLLAAIENKKASYLSPIIKRFLILFLFKNTDVFFIISM